MSGEKTNPLRSPDRTSKRKWQTGFKFGVVEALVILSILATVASFVLPPVRKWNGSHSSLCLIRTRDIQLALSNYHQDYGSFPPAMLNGADGHPAHSWRVLILPYLDQQELYDRYDFNEPWDGPNNILLQDEIPEAYRCPIFLKGVELGSVAHQHLSCLSNYVAINSIDGVFDGEKTTRRDEITDDLSSTIMVTEVRQHAVHWMSPVDVTPHQLLTDLRRTQNKEHANHPGRLNVGLVDGSVLAIPHNMDEADLRSCITKSQGEGKPTNF